PLAPSIDKLASPIETAGPAPAPEPAVAHSPGGEGAEVPAVTGAADRAPAESASWKTLSHPVKSKPATARRRARARPAAADSDDDAKEKVPAAAPEPRKVDPFAD